MFNHRKIRTRLYGRIGFLSLLLIVTAFISLRSAALGVGNTRLAALQDHTIISSAGYIGAVELEELAQILETAIALGEPSASISVALERFAADLAQLTADIRKHLQVIPDIGMANLPDGAEEACINQSYI